ncbi:MAG TPA: potassium-transporting ATPase subunit KdpC [Terrimesophilobacter sp.]|nr:potassium-transporting ATPase subunit KdpC [Terrimesophilobacter sp.]
MNIWRGMARQYSVAIRVLLVFTVVCGVVYPLAITGVALVLPAQANGSLLSVGGRVVGSSLIGQSFAGTATSGWFQSRPSAVDYDGRNSGGSNLAEHSTSLATSLAERRAAVSAADGVAARDVPPDALTASASGLDPQISPEYARLQVNRVAASRGLKESDVTSLVESFVQGRGLGFLGEPTVNVLELNIALDRLARHD